jgi:hypothetical protein
MARTCQTGVCDPRRTQGLKTNVAKANHILVQGPGVFVSAVVSKQGGASGLSFVSLDLDGRNVTNLSYAAAVNLGLTQANPYGLAVMNSGVVQAFTVGFPVPLRFERELVLSVKVNEPGVVQLVGNVITGTA